MLSINEIINDKNFMERRLDEMTGVLSTRGFKQTMNSQERTLWKKQIGLLRMSVKNLEKMETLENETHGTI